jgi:hypothetical protein
MNTSLQELEAHRLKSLPKTEGLALPRPQEDLFKFSGLADFLGFLDLACGSACATVTEGWNASIKAGQVRPPFRKVNHLKLSDHAIANS